MSDKTLDSIFSAVIFLSGLGVLGWQSFLYLRDGFWTPISLMSFFQHIATSEVWEELKGLRKVLTEVPVSAVLLIFGYLGMVSSSRT
jgi:hypothetical protein